MVPVPDTDFINRAVDAARTASPTWSQSSLSKRTNILFSLRQLIVERTDDLAALITLEHGKTTADAKGEIARAHRKRGVRLRALSNTSKVDSPTR